MNNKLTTQSKTISLFELFLISLYIPDLFFFFCYNFLATYVHGFYMDFDIQITLSRQEQKVHRLSPKSTCKHHLDVRHIFRFQYYSECTFQTYAFSIISNIINSGVDWRHIGFVLLFTFITLKSTEYFTNLKANEGGFKITRTVRRM